MSQAPPDESTTAHDECEGATIATGTSSPERANQGLATQLPSLSPLPDLEASSAPTRLGQNSDATPSAIERLRGVHRRRDPERYQILGEHGRGGLGCVSRAHDLDLDRDIAIKELISRGHSSEARFMREALITARLEHPGIVPVYEAGRWPDGTPFYAMKLVAGRPLRELIAERTTVAERIGLLHHVIAVADAIAYAHGRNIIHRDLKPANIVVGDFGETIVIDWGLAKDLTASEEPLLEGGPCHVHHDDGLTRTGAVLGTPTYMAPEQARGEHVDQRADVFAIGAMLWELCSLQKVPPSERRLRHRLLRRSGIDADLITILDKALAPDPSRRYPDAGALAADLKAFKSGVRIAARSYSLLALLAHWTRRHRALAWSAGSALVVVTAFGVLYIRSITAERDRTSGALQRVEAAKNDLVLEHAALLLQSDPTAALAALEGYFNTDTSRHTESLPQTDGPGMSRSVAPPAAHRSVHIDSPDVARRQRAAQVAADALGRGITTYILSPNIGTIAYLTWSPVDKILIQGTDDKFLDWQIDHKTPDHELSLATFGHSSADAHRQWLAYQGRNGVIRLRNLQTSQETELGHLDGTPWALVVSPAGHHVAAAASIGDIVLWDNSARVLGSHSRPPGVYQALRFSPDSSMLAACGRDGRLVVWSVETGAQVADGQCDGLANIDYEFANDSRSLIIGSRSGALDQLRILDGNTPVGNKFSIAVVHGAITEIVAGPNMSVFVGSDIGELILYDVPTMRVLWRSQLASGITQATYDRYYNLLFAGCSDGRIAMITGTGRSAGTLQGHTSGISAISLSEGSRWLASGSADGTVRIWSLPVPAVQSVHIASAPLFSAKFSPDGKLVATEAQDGTVSTCATRTLECITTVAHQSLASGLAWNHKGTALASTGWDGRLRVWNRDSNESTYLQLSAETGALYLHGYLKDDQSALLLFQGKTWEIRRIEDRQSTPSLVIDSKASVSLSADGARLAVATTAGSLSIWDTSHATPQLLSTTILSRSERFAPAVTLSPSGRFVVVQFASGALYLAAISIHGKATLKVVPNLGAGTPWLASFSPDEEHVGVSYSDGRIVMIHTATREQIGHQPLATAATGLWMGNLRLVAFTREGYVWIYDRTSGAQCVTHIEKESILGASLSPDESTLAIAGESGRLHFFGILSCRWAKSS